MSGDNSSDVGALAGRIRVSDRHRVVQAAAFALLLAHGRPVSGHQIAERTELTHADVEALLADFDAVGRVRFDLDGHVVGIAGLSIEPTRHRIDLDGTIRWTWCALDAIGILGALGRPATYTTEVPDTGAQLELQFGPDGPADGDAVVFIADGYGTDSVVETWCPSVNLFPDAPAAEAWARAHVVTGRPVAVSELAVDAVAMWAPIVAAA